MSQSFLIGSSQRCWVSLSLSGTWCAAEAYTLQPLTTQADKLACRNIHGVPAHVIMQTHSNLCTSCMTVHHVFKHCRSETRWSDWPKFDNDRIIVSDIFFLQAQLSIALRGRWPKLALSRKKNISSSRRRERLMLFLRLQTNQILARETFTTPGYNWPWPFLHCCHGNKWDEENVLLLKMFSPFFFLNTESWNRFSIIA